MNKLSKPKWKRLTSLLLLVVTAFTLCVPSVFAEGEGMGGESGNAITESSIFQGLLKMLNDFSAAMLIIAPIGCGILIGVFALLKGSSHEPHDKEKWDKNIKTVLIVLIIVFCASGLTTLVTGYFKG